MFASAETAACYSPEEPGFISTFSPQAEAWARYQDLENRLKALQEKKANIDLDFKLAGEHPEFYASPKGQDYLARARERRPKLRQEIEDVRKQRRALEDYSPLRERLERELRANGHDSPPATGGNQTTRVTLRKPSELVARPISWRVEGILPDGMLTVLHARDKVGKTLFAWEAARAVLKQQALMGTFTVTPGRVVLALLDDPHELTVQRRDALGLTDCEDLRIVTPLDADLSDPVAFLADFKKECGEFKPQLVVIDALYQFAPTGKDSMNDAARMRGPMGVFNSLAETLRAAVLLIAHDRNDGSDVAGSHVIRANAKTLLHLTKPKWGEEEEEDDGRRILTVVSKMTAEARHLLRNQGVGAWSYVGRGDSARQARTTWAQDRVLTWLKEGAEGTAQEVAKAVKVRREDALSALTSLVEEGQVESELQPRADGRKGKGRLVYRLAGPNGPEPGNKSPKETDGNNRSEAQKPAPNAEKNDRPNVPPLKNQAGTIGQAQKPTIDGLFYEDQTYRSQNPLSKGEDGNNSFSDSREAKRGTCRHCLKPDCLLTQWGWHCRLSDEDKQRWEERQQAEAREDAEVF